MIRYILILAISLLMCGCGTTAKFVYPANQQNLICFSPESKIDIQIAVPPFNDYRGDNNSSGTWLIGYIPLFPFGWCDYERPDSARMFLSINSYEITPSEDLAKATALSLRQSGLFKDAYFTFGGEKQNADLILYGTLQEMRYRGNICTYCLSVYGPLLWFLGLPCGSSKCTLAIDFELKTQNGDILWKYSKQCSDKVVQSLYSKMGHDCKAFAVLMQQITNDALQSLAQDMESNPNKYIKNKSQK